MECPKGRFRETMLEILTLACKVSFGKHQVMSFNELFPFNHEVYGLWPDVYKLVFSTV
jgi:hypothetical protein